MWELQRITSAKEIVEKDEDKLQCDLGRFSTAQIIKLIRDKFKAAPAHTGSGINKRRAIYLTKENLERKKIDFDNPKEIKISPSVNTLSGPDDFDSILSDGSGTRGTRGTHSGGMDGESSSQKVQDTRSNPSEPTDSQGSPPDGERSHTEPNQDIGDEKVKEKDDIHPVGARLERR